MFFCFRYDEIVYRDYCCHDANYEAVMAAKMA